MNKLKISMTGIAWYRPDTYDRCMSIFGDAAELPDTYDDWVVIAEAREKQLVHEGAKTVRVEIDPDTFPGWCAEHGYTNIDAEARRDFASRMALDFIGE